MPLIALTDVTLSFGDPPVLEGVTLQIDAGERLCLLGRNGAGKSTLLKLLAGELAPDRGDVARSRDVRVALLSQDVPGDLPGSVREVVAQGRPASADRVAVNAILSRMSLDPGVPFQTLSVGLRRRALLARALAAEPDLLLLDEPTNHLDIDAITWLEAFLLKRSGSLLFVTHDRELTRRLATRIVEIDRGRLSSWACDYDTYLRRRDARIDADSAAQEQFDRRLAEEEAWIRQGIKARRTRNEGRVRALKAMREERSRMRVAAGQVRIAAQDGERTSRTVIEAEGLCFGYGGAPVIDGFSTSICRGDKVGFIGPNGSGKTTLLRLLLGDLPPQSGSLRHGLRLQVACFDQMREQLDEDRTVFDTIADGNDRVAVDGKMKHVYSYLSDFLFPAARARCLVRVLSGGERNRLLLARLFARPANVLALDEPTNDLDAETLEVLESTLVDYTGTVLVVSHDRAFLNNVATSVIAFEGSRGIHEYVGGYDDWLRQRPEPLVAEPAAPPRPAVEPRRRERDRKLRNKEARELQELPQRIESLECEQRALRQTLSDPGIYRDGTNIPELKSRLEAVSANVEAAYARWQALDELSSTRLSPQPSGVEGQRLRGA